MQVTINQSPVQLPDGATVATAIAQWAPPPPFAVAVNLAFIPQSSYATHQLQGGDKIEIIAPVTGG